MEFSFLLASSLIADNIGQSFLNYYLPQCNLLLHSIACPVLICRWPMKMTEDMLPWADYSRLRLLCPSTLLIAASIYAFFSNVILRRCWLVLPACFFRRCTPFTSTLGLFLLNSLSNTDRAATFVPASRGKNHRRLYSRLPLIVIQILPLFPACFGRFGSNKIFHASASANAFSCAPAQLAKSRMQSDERISCACQKMPSCPCSTAFSFSPTQPSTEGVSILRTANRRAPPDRPVGRARDMRDHTTPWPASAYAMSLIFFPHGTGRGFFPQPTHNHWCVVVTMHSWVTL